MKRRLYEALIFPRAGGGTTRGIGLGTIGCFLQRSGTVVPPLKVDLKHKLMRALVKVCLQAMN